ncbi:hypothetical protein GE09DRAFT_1250761 [Coniochaeta sp. 2T2.1]|nr:hypothetical protein GE09DRAFT_1250761 [Coniochaeta sp. 2T2.1]
MAFVGMIMEVAGILTTISFAAVQGMGGYNGAATGVKIIAGQGDGSIGGSTPHIALWDDHGSRIGQYHPGKKEKTIDENGQRSVVIKHDQTTPPGRQADPMYVMLSNFENNAICVSAVYVSNGKISGTFYGDVGFMCGMDWYPSSGVIDSNFYAPRCVWLDADHTNGINARALSFHLNDVAAQPDKLAEYNDNPDTLCKSTPRFSFWGNLEPDGQIPFFNPPLKYNTDSVNGGQGSDKDPLAVIDKPNQYDKSVYTSQAGRKNNRKTRGARRTVKISNINSDHLVVTDMPSHSAREVCEHPNSVGWDIVSTTEGLFCHLTDRQLYPLCSGTVTVNCFDMGTLQLKTLVQRDGNFAVQPRGYNTTAHWK